MKTNGTGVSIKPFRRYTPDTDAPVNPDPAFTGYVPHNYGDDYIDAVSVFGGVKKTILSKDFKGGDIVNIFGGAEMDLTQADINGRVILDITQIFGGTKIVVPSHWQVVSDIAAVFAGVDDKRLRNGRRRWRKDTGTERRFHFCRDRHPQLLTLNFIEMNWYVAKIVFRIISGEGNHNAQFDEQLRLISAEDERQAFEKATVLG